MKNSLLWYLLVFLILSTDQLVGQPIKNPCLYQSLTRKSTREALLARYQILYDLQPRQKIASVGAGGGNKEILYSMLADSLVFYLQDIDSTCLSKAALPITIQQHYKATSQVCDDTFISVIGTETDTKLPERFFDKVLIENTLHELTKPEEILQSIRNSLKPDGFLFIEDFIAHKPGQRHRGCGKLLYTQQALIDLLDKSGFRLVESHEVYPKNTVDRVYKFALK
ncbi:class I SAM-dependent methyltransferase [Spirosoma soli]|uniref:Class I SAM-dependent methyltransferase n=1 Tax=Spirosoma soli TaxID=1770529 RepID=A0ABW5M2K7_9BACT